MLRGGGESIFIVGIFKRIIMYLFVNHISMTFLSDFNFIRDLYEVAEMCVNPYESSKDIDFSYCGKIRLYEE